MSEKVTYHVDRDRKVVSWQVRENMTVEDAQAAATEIKNAVESFNGEEVMILVDNRYMIRAGRPIVFTPDVNKIWGDLQGYLLLKVTKVAVLCCSMMLKMQMDRIARESELISKLQSYYNEDHIVSAKEAYEFLGISGNKLIDTEIVQA